MSLSTGSLSRFEHGENNDLVRVLFCVRRRYLHTSTSRVHDDTRSALPSVHDAAAKASCNKLAMASCNSDMDFTTVERQAAPQPFVGLGDAQTVFIRWVHIYPIFRSPLLAQHHYADRIYLPRMLACRRRPGSHCGAERIYLALGLLQSIYLHCIGMHEHTWSLML